MGAFMGEGATQQVSAFLKHCRRHNNGWAEKSCSERAIEVCVQSDVGTLRQAELRAGKTNALAPEFFHLCGVTGKANSAPDYTRDPEQQKSRGDEIIITDYPPWSVG